LGFIGRCAHTARDEIFEIREPDAVPNRLLFARVLCLCCPVGIDQHWPVDHPTFSPALGIAHAFYSRKDSLMTLALRNKQMVALLVLALLTVLIIVAFIAMSVAHFNLFEALHITPSVAAPWF